MAKGQFRGYADFQFFSIHTKKDWVEFNCPDCGKVSSPLIAYYPHSHGKWLICPGCAEPVAIRSDGTIWPPVTFGSPVVNLPPTVELLYQEVRRCIGIGAFTSAELSCRTLLMHAAVDKAGAKAGDTFAACIDALTTAGFITPAMKPWVDKIRQNANKCAHEIDPPDQDRAKDTAMFTERLLTLVYDPHNQAVVP